MISLLAYLLKIKDHDALGTGVNTEATPFTKTFVYNDPRHESVLSIRLNENPLLK
jgi:hypothetical protein